MRFFAMMFNTAAIATAEIKSAIARATGGAGYRKNKITIATARALLIAYAMQARARQDIAMYSSPRL